MRTNVKLKLAIEVLVFELLVFSYITRYHAFDLPVAQQHSQTIVFIFLYVKNSAIVRGDSELLGSCLFNCVDEVHGHSA